MKKFLAILITCFLSAQIGFASEDVSFIYINGSNNNNTKMKNWYENGVRKLHPILRKKFLKNKTIKKYYANFGGLNIKEEPVIFFWGYNSKNDLNYVKNQLEISKMVSSSGAYLVRSLITQYMHDAIWVQKPHNMNPILDDLNDKVLEETKDGSYVVLYGYSAGTFVAFQYMLNKFRYINLENLFKTLEADDELMKYITYYKQNDTCISALEHTRIGTISATGHMILNPNRQMLKNNYPNLNEMTEKYCAPVDKVAGVVNFASPLPLFYSDMSDKNFELNYYNRLMTKYVMENGIFTLTVNFREDPLGFPTSNNLTAKEIEARIDMPIENPTGVMYDNSGVWSKRMFAFAHTSYWTARKTFANAIVKSFVDGYKFQYNEKFQEEVIKKNSKKSEL